MTQTVFARLQRVTIQCVVKTVGLHKELIKMPTTTAAAANADFLHSSSWIHLTTAFATTHDVETLEKLEPVKADAVSIAASLLKIPFDDEDSMALIRDKSTFVSCSPGEDLFQTGMPGTTLYILLK
eukprot:13241720-Ditylum_brightwellii.AAC.1